MHACTIQGASKRGGRKGRRRIATVKAFGGGATFCFNGGGAQRVATPINLYSWLFRSRGTHRAATESLCIRCARKTFLQSEFERGGIHPRGWRFAGPRGRNPRSLGLRGKLQHASGVCVTPPWGHMVEWVPVYDIDRPPYPPQSCSNVVRSTAEVSQGSGGCSP